MLSKCSMQALSLGFVLKHCLAKLPRIHSVSQITLELTIFLPHPVLGLQTGTIKLSYYFSLKKIGRLFSILCQMPGAKEVTPAAPYPFTTWKICIKSMNNNNEFKRIHM